MAQTLGIQGKGSTGEDWFNEEASETPHPPSTVVKSTAVTVDGEEFLVEEMSNATVCVYRGTTRSKPVHFMAAVLRKVLAAYRAA